MLYRFSDIRSPGSPEQGSAAARTGFLAGVLLGALLIGGSAPASPSPQPVTNSVTADIAQLRDAAATPANRAGSARRLLASSEPEARQFLLSALAVTSEEAATRDAIVRELARRGTTPEWALEALNELLARGPEAKRAELLACVGGVRTREGVRTLLSFAQGAQPQAMRDAAFQALARLTGHWEFGTDLTRWTDWFAGVEWLPELDWRRTLSEGLAQYSVYMEVQRDTLQRRLVESERRRLIEATGEDERWNILAAQLKDDLPALCRLGVELVTRELANAKRPGPVVGRAALSLLDDAAPDMRLAAVNLIDRLQPEGAAAAISQALLKEKDTNVVAALLRQAERWPTPESRSFIISLLDDPEPVSAAAVRAVASMLSAGLLTNHEDRSKAIETLRKRNLRDIDAAGMRLVCELGDHTERDAVASLLRDVDSARRLAAAQALSDRADRLDEVAAAAQSDSALFGVAAQMIGRFQATTAGFDRLAALPAPALAPDGNGTSDPKREALLALADRFRSDELYGIARQTSDLSLKEAILARFMSLPVAPLGWSSSTKNAYNAVVVAGLLLLAETRLQLYRPGAALAALDTLEDAGIPVNHEKFASLKAQALLGLNRIAEAIELDAPASAWIKSLAEIIDLPHAPAVLQVLLVNYDGVLTPAEQQAIKPLQAAALQRHPDGRTTTDESRPKRGPRG